MFERFQSDGETSAEHLVASGYWPARAAQFLADGTWSRVVEICKESLDEEPGCCSGRLIYARALYHAGQVESATEQFYRVLALDAENIVALKYLGDIKFTEHDEPAALAHYRRVLEIDPYCHALRSPIKSSRPETTRTITLTRGTPRLSAICTLPRGIPDWRPRCFAVCTKKNRPRSFWKNWNRPNERYT